MIIENLTPSGNSSEKQILAFAQTITNYFLEALEQNDCNVKIVLGFYHEIEDTVASIEDLSDAFYPIELNGWDRPIVTYPEREQSSAFTYRRDDSPGMDAAIEALKQRCFNCKLKLPKITFSHDFKFLYNKLNLKFEIFDLVFKDKVNKVNLCHVGFALQKSCIPDILKLIGLLLQACTAILALNKLPKISLSVFIKAIIGKLIASVVANVSISVDMSQTGVPCIISALEEIAKAALTKENIYNLQMDGMVRKNLFPEYQSLSTYESNLKDKLKNNQITEREYAEQLEAYRKKNDPFTYYANELQRQMDKTEQSISKSFKIVSDTVTRAQDEINAYLQSILGVINYFECEGSRTGPDFSELMQYVNQLVSVINFMTSILNTYLNKIFGDLLCKDEKVVKDLKDIPDDEIIKAITDIPDEPLSNEDLAKAIEDFLETETKLSDDGTSILIYDKPVKSKRPKLTLLGCNLKEFAEAHTIDNLIKDTVNQIIEDNTSSNNTNSPNNPANIPGLAPWTKNPISLPDRNYYKPIEVKLPVINKNIFNLKPDVHLLEDLLNRQRIPLPYNNSIRDIINNNSRNPSTIIPGTVLNPNINIIDKTNNPELHQTVEDTLSKVKDPEVIGTINIPTVSADPNNPSIIKEIDDILDLIYDNPITKKPTDNENNYGIDPITSTPNVNPEEINIKDMYQETIEKESKLFNSRVSECRDIDDVLDILNSIKIR